jgi:hypothetical protein
VQNVRIWQRVLGLGRTVIEGVAFDDEAEVVVVW